MATSETNTLLPYLSLQLACHCKTFSHTITFPTTGNLPLKSALCHCRICRHVSGQMFATFAVIPPGVPSPSTAGLKYYQHTFQPTQDQVDSRKGIKRNFCSKCGASVWNDEFDDWEIATGIIEKVTFKSSLADPDGDDNKPQADISNTLDRVELYSGAASTGDGGAAIWINGGNIKAMERYEDGRNSALLTSDELQTMKKRNAEELRTQPATQDTLRGTCACGVVQISLKSSRTKYPASLCACKSCRKCIGFEITSWFTVPKSSVLVGKMEQLLFIQDCGQPVSSVAEGAGLTMYSSSPGVLRAFCSECGSKFFYFKANDKTCDINPGIFANEKRARLEKWLEWHAEGHDPVSFVEDAIDPKYVKGIVEGVLKDN